MSGRSGSGDRQGASPCSLCAEFLELDTTTQFLTQQEMRTSNPLVDFKSRVGPFCSNICLGKTDRSPFFRHFLIGLNITLAPIQGSRS